jgi:hypothetical protein
MQYAMRDGIVGTVDQTVTSGRYGATTLTLLTGEEEDGEVSYWQPKHLN